MKKSSFYITPQINVVSAMDDLCQALISASKISGSTDQPDISEIGDGGDNEDDAPLPLAKQFTSLWNDDEEEVDDIW